MVTFIGYPPDRIERAAGYLIPMTNCRGIRRRSFRQIAFRSEPVPVSDERIDGRVEFLHERVVRRIRRREYGVIEKFCRAV